MNRSFYKGLNKRSINENISPAEQYAQVNIAGNQGEYSTIEQLPSVKGSSPARSIQMKHHRAMSTVQNGENAHCDEFVSPYSVLRGSTDQDVDYAIQKLQ